MPDRRFPPPWSVDDPDKKLGQDCYIVRDGTFVLALSIPTGPFLHSQIVLSEPNIRG